MPVGRNRRPRLHFKPLKKNEIRCTLVAQNSRGQQVQTLEFQEEQNEWHKKWDLNKTITYALIKDSNDITKNGLERAAVYYAMMTWALEIPIHVKLVKKNQNPKITIEFTDPSKDKFFKLHPQTLAFAYYPGTVKQGIIKFNDDYLWSLNGKKSGANPTHNMVHTLIHEIGHALGLTHSVGIHSSNSVMHPAYSEKLKLSAYDKMRIVKIYGNRQWDDYQDYQNFKNSIYSLIINF